MTNPNDGKAPTPKEAVEKVGSIINDQVHAMRSHASVYCSDRESGQMRSEAEFLAEALAVLEALAEENEKLQTFQSWASDELDLAKKEYLKLVESEAGLRAENAALKAEVVEWKDNYADAQGDAACYKAQADSFATLASEHKSRAETAKAENERLSRQHDQCHDTNNELVKEHFRLKAELTRFAPLIEAARGWTADDKDRISRALDQIPHYVPIAEYKCPGQVLRDKFTALLAAIPEGKP